MLKLKVTLLKLSWVVVRGLIPLLNKKRADFSYLIPSDKKCLTGARGDEAMLVAAIERIKKNNPEHEVKVTCIDQECIEKAKDFDVGSLRAWKGPFMPLEMMFEIRKRVPRQVFLMGADIMDGYYSPLSSLKMVVAADICAKMGAEVIFLGFSLNKEPSQELKAAFKKIDKSVKINLRDPVSYERFLKLFDVRANLVADTAFLLEPKSDSSLFKKISQWVATFEPGTKVVALNFNKHLFKNEEELKQLGDSFVRFIESYNNKEKIAWVLMPHDDRSHAGDIFALTYVSKKLSEKGLEHFLITSPPSAQHIKGICSLFDAVISGRMHFAIAALGQGKPVMVLTYQGKFGGLMKHFNLPEWLEVSPNKAINPDFLEAELLRFFSELSSIKEVVEERKPIVRALAQKTFG